MFPSCTVRPVVQGDPLRGAPHPLHPFVPLPTLSSPPSRLEDTLQELVRGFDKVPRLEKFTPWSDMVRLALEGRRPWLPPRFQGPCIKDDACACPDDARLGPCKVLSSGVLSGVPTLPRGVASYAVKEPNTKNYTALRGHTQTPLHPPPEGGLVRC